MKEYVDAKILEMVIYYAKRAPEDGLVCMTQGNISAKDSQTGYIAITPHNAPYQGMSTSDLVIVDSMGKKIAGHLNPSFETPVHCMVYRERSDVMAIVHTEPIYVNVFGALNREIPPLTNTMLKSSRGTIPIMPHKRSGSEEFAIEMLEIMGDRNAVVWANHGLLVVGSSVENAYGRSVVVEQGAQIYLHTLLLGQPQTLEHIDPKIFDEN
jgi:L-ribulose-5-phosphate 4-epimerase